MGTRGLKVYRFRKRYYAFYNHWDSYPDGLGKQIVSDIPADPSKYQAWLAEQRAAAANWKAGFETFLTIIPGNKINSQAIKEGWNEDEERKEGVEESGDEGEGEEVSNESKKSDGVAEVDQDLEKDGHDEADESGKGESNQASDEETNENSEDQTPKTNMGYMEHEFPSFLTPMNDVWIEWVYTIDLDNETFTVNNGAHFKLEMMPHIDWIGALDRGGLDKAIVVPGKVPEKAVVDLLADDIDTQFSDVSIEEVTLPARKLITPKGLDSIPWYIRHGAILRSLIFYFWSTALEEKLSATLLQLAPSDLMFRELSYAVLCMAVGGRFMSVLRKRNLPNNTAFGFISIGKTKRLAEAEFFSVLGTGAHLKGEKPGSAPQDTVYWLDNVLVYLTAHLYREVAVDRGVARVARYCKTHHPDTVIDAVLISIEHAVLVHISPPHTQNKDIEIQHSSLLPLFDIEDHTSMHTTSRYTQSYLSEFTPNPSEKFLRRQKKRHRTATHKRSLKSEGINMGFGDDEEVLNVSDDEDEFLRPTQVEGDALGTFYALQHIFSAASRRQLRLNQQGRFPTEIYECIVSHTLDASTRDTLLHTSHVLREVCLKQFLLCETNHTVLKPCEACKACEEPQQVPRYCNEYNLVTKEERTVNVKKTGGFMPFDSGDELMVLVGGEGKRSLLSEIIFEFKECEKLADDDEEEEDVEEGEDEQESSDEDGEQEGAKKESIPSRRLIPALTTLSC